MENLIYQYAIGELLDGRYFYIPAYQRGYRWTKKQVGDLLRDLLCFANDPKKDGDFYCLQPVITRPITDEEKIKELFPNENYTTIKEHGVWEVIDGQQRLTSIFLLYKYLIDQKGWDAERLAEEEDGKQLYHLYYATRKGSNQFLENLNLTNAEDDKINDNVDYYYMANAYKYIDQWIKEDGKDINVRYKLGGSLGKVRDALFTLLNGLSDTKDGSVQVLWYQLGEVDSSNPISEFQKINTGQIRLTDAELIKGLFLLKRNFDSESKYIKQSQLAIEWEFIENTLHSNKFWYFLQKKGIDMPNRIDLLFTLLYKIDKISAEVEDVWDTKLKEIDKVLQDPRQSEIFRFYYNRFEGKTGDELQQEVATAWDEVMTLFRTLDDWYNSPALYNYIGLLSQCGEDLTHLVLYFQNLPEQEEHEIFKKYLIERLRSHLNTIKVDSETQTIQTLYSSKNRTDIYNLLLTLNIHLLNLQIQNNEMNNEIDSDIYKFPFDLLNNQNWDIEHIDSYHTNALKSEKDKIEWIKTARADREDDLSDQEKNEIEKLMGEKDYEQVMIILKNNAKEVDADEELKNSIGNLTLLDSSTNRQYGNSLFCTKRRIIIERIKQGIFIPIGTQYVFSKFFDLKGTNRSYWTIEDMKEYHKYIYEMVKNYLTF